MARSRILKPGFFTNENLVEHDPWVRLLFAGLWCLADREGRLEDRPKKIKMEVFPADGFDVEEGLSKLAYDGFIERYEVDGNRYIQITGWGSHQKVHRNEAPSIIPKKGENSKINQEIGELPEKCPTSTSTSTSTSYTPTPPEGACVSFEEKFDPEVLEAAQYLRDSKNPNLMNAGWVKGYLQLTFAESRKEGISPAHFLACWRETCDDASAKAVSGAKWYKTVLESKLKQPVKPVRQGGEAVVKNKAELIRQAWGEEKTLTHHFAGTHPATALQPVDAGYKPVPIEMAVSLRPGDGDAYRLNEWKIVEGERS